MHNPFTRCSYEVTTFLTRRSKASNASSALSQMLRAPIGFVMAPSRKIISMLGRSGKIEVDDAVSGSSVTAAGGGGVDKPSQTKRRKRQINTSGESPKIDTPVTDAAGQPSSSENPFTGVNAEAGCVPEASKIAAFAGASARAGGAKAPQLRSASMLSKDEQERAEARMCVLVPLGTLVLDPLKNIFL